MLLQCVEVTAVSFVCFLWVQRTLTEVQRMVSIDHNVHIAVFVEISSLILNVTSFRHLDNFQKCQALSMSLPIWMSFPQR